MELELITAPYTDDIQVQMRSSSFRSFDLIEYFVVFVGKQIDCEKSTVFKVYSLLLVLKIIKIQNKIRSISLVRG